MENIINFEELREGLEPNQEYIERIAKVAGNSEDIVADVTYEMFENLQSEGDGIRALKFSKHLCVAEL